MKEFFPLKSTCWLYGDMCLTNSNARTTCKQVYSSQVETDIPVSRATMSWETSFRDTMTRKVENTPLYEDLPAKLLCDLAFTLSVFKKKRSFRQNIVGLYTPKRPTTSQTRFIMQNEHAKYPLHVQGWAILIVLLPMSVVRRPTTCFKQHLLYNRLAKVNETQQGCSLHTVLQQLFKRMEFRQETWMLWQQKWKTLKYLCL